MFKRVRFITALGAVVLGAAGCVVIDNSLSPRVSTLNFGIDRAVNDAILTNIVRASRSQPLTFVAIAKVSGSQQATLATGLPTLNFGPDLTPQQKVISFANNSLNQQAAGNFDVAPLAGRDFTKGLLLPLSMIEIELLLRQGLPRELLYNLIFESIEYTLCDPGTVKGIAPKRTCKGKPSVVTNSLLARPQPKALFTFPQFAKQLATYGFNVESRQEANPHFVKGDKADQVARTIVASRFCFDTVNPNEFNFDREWQCGTDWYYSKRGSLKTQPNQQSTLFYEQIVDYYPTPKTPKSQTLKLKDIKLQVRSIYGIFRYLGEQLASPASSALAVSLHDKSPPHSLLHIETAPALSCFASVRFDAEHYCVPENGSPATKLVFSILAQLIALKTQPGDLPFTPTVRIAP